MEYMTNLKLYFFNTYHVGDRYQQEYVRGGK